MKPFTARQIQIAPREATPIVSAVLLMVLVQFYQSSACAQDFEPPSAPVFAKRGVTVADSIGMSLLADERYYAGYSSSAPPALFSPDGRQFVVVLRRGVLERNTNSCRILLWQTAAA